MSRTRPPDAYLKTIVAMCGSPAQTSIECYNLEMLFWGGCAMNRFASGNLVLYVESRRKVCLV